MAAVSFTPRATNSCAKFEATLSSSQTIHGTGGLVGSPEPGKINGSTALRLVLKLRLGSLPPRSSPACCHAPLATSNRLANRLVAPPNVGLASYQVVHRTA